MGIFKSRAKGGPDVRPELPTRPEQSHFFVPQWGNVTLTTVVEDQVLGVPFAAYCVNLISRAVSTIGPPTVYDGAGNVVDSPLIISRPVAGCLPFNTYQDMTRALIMHGNLVMVPVGEQFLILPPSMTDIFLSNDGRKQYQCGNLKYSQGEVVHIAANTSAGNGGIGMGVVKQFMRSMGRQLDEQALSANLLRNNAVPPAILKIDVDTLTAEQATESAEAWTSAREAGAIAVLSKLMSFEKVAWNPDEMEFLESRKFSVAEMGACFGISPTFLGASLGGSLTYETMQGARAAFLLESVGPYLQVLEEGLSDVLAGDFYAKFEVENYQRMTPAEKDSHDAAGIAGGWLTVDEVRASRGLPVLGVAA